jgi:hypothetical protein
MSSSPAVKPAACPPRPERKCGRALTVGPSWQAAVLAGELRDDAGEVLATATATARIIRPAPGATRYGQPGPQAR